jgi:hypothetical protein
MRANDEIYSLKGPKLSFGTAHWARRAHEAHDVGPLKVLLAQARKLCADICDALERANPEANEYCLLLSNCADDLDDFIAGIERLQEKEL